MPAAFVKVLFCISSLVGMAYRDTSCCQSSMGGECKRYKYKSNLHLWMAFLTT